MAQADFFEQDPMFPNNCIPLQLPEGRSYGMDLRQYGDMLLHFCFTPFLDLLLLVCIEALWYITSNSIFVFAAKWGVIEHISFYVHVNVSHFWNGSE